MSLRIYSKSIARHTPSPVTNVLPRTLLRIWSQLCDLQRELVARSSRNFKEEIWCQIVAAMDEILYNIVHQGLT